MRTDKAFDVLETRAEPPVCMSGSTFDRSLVFARAKSPLRVRPHSMITPRLIPELQDVRITVGADT
jgi:hypothetical protein